MNQRTSSIEDVCVAVNAAISDLGFAASWHVRLRAAQLLIAHITQSLPTVQVVRGIAYGRSALFRLGEPMLPQTDLEMVHYRERVGPAMLLLGFDQLHAVLIVGGHVLVELASWNDHDDPGVLMQPFVRVMPPEVDERFVVDGISTGAAIAYQRVDDVLPPLNRTYEQMARQLATSCAPRIRWQLDSQRSRKESPA